MPTSARNRMGAIFGRDDVGSEPKGRLGDCLVLHISNNPSTANAVPLPLHKVGFVGADVAGGI